MKSSWSFRDSSDFTKQVIVGLISVVILGLIGFVSVVVLIKSNADLVETFRGDGPPHLPPTLESTTDQPDSVGSTEETDREPQQVSASRTNEPLPADSSTTDEDPALPLEPCDSRGNAVCTARDVRGFSIVPTAGGSAYHEGPSTPSVEDVLEFGLYQLGVSPVHLVISGTASSDDIRCLWRGNAQTASQREDSIRFWLQLDDDDPLPSASEVEAEFMTHVNAMVPRHRPFEAAGFRAIAHGGLDTDLVTLACYVEYEVNEYILGDGPDFLNVGYDFLDRATSFELHVARREAGEFDEDPPLTEGEYLQRLNEIRWETETELTELVGDRESVVFLMPLAVHSAITIETWQAVDQWDLQVYDGVVQAVRIGAELGQPEYSQPYADLKTRITTAAAADSFAGQRIENEDGLEDYYRTTGAYDDITPDDGISTTFTPAQPPPKLSCAGDSAVANPEDNRPLAHDCQALLAVKDVIRGSGSLNWDSNTDLASWDGVTSSGTPTRVTELILSSESLTGSIPSDIGNLWGLTGLDLGSNDLTGTLPNEMGNLSNLEFLNLSNSDLDGSIPARFSDLSKLTYLRLAGNSFTGCIPQSLHDIADNDNDQLGIGYCIEVVPDSFFPALGQTVAMSVTAPDVPTYQWQSLVDGAWSDISGASSATYSMGYQSVTTGQYRVVVTHHSGIVSTSPAVVIAWDHH